MSVETEKKPRVKTENEFRIAANIEAWFERLKPSDRKWVLIKLNEKYGGRLDTAGPDT